MVLFANWKLEIFLAGDLDLIQNAERDILDRVIAEIEKRLKVLIKTLENKHLNP